MASPKKSAEIVTDQDLDPVLKNKTFDRTVFLRLYSEWKVTNDTNTFASLRKMHEDAGYNNKAILPWSSEQEMHEIAAIIQKYQDGKSQLAVETATATAATQATVQASTQTGEKFAEVSPFDATKIQALKTALENEAKSPLTPDGLSKILDRLKDEKNPDNRAVIGSWVWSKMNHTGYRTTIQNNTISIAHDTDKMGATSLEKTLQAYISANILTVADIQRAMIVGPESFGKYLDTQKVNIRNASTEGYARFIMEARGIDLKKANTLEHKTRIIQTSKATPDEKAFLLSYVNGGLSTYNITPELERHIQMSAIDAAIQAAPAHKTAAGIVNTTSGGGMAAEQEKRAKEGKSKNLTWKELVDNPLQAFTTYPWMAILLIMLGGFNLVPGVELGWGKTIGGLAVGMLALKAGAEANDKFGGEKKDTERDTQSIPALVPVPLSNIDTKGLSPSQQNAMKALIPHENRIQTAIASRYKTNQKFNASMKDYVEFIHSQDFQNQKLSSIIFTSDSTKSIFTESKATEFTANRPASLDPAILKLVLRGYLGIGIDPSGTANTPDWGKKEKDAFMAKVKIDETWKDKTFGEITKQTYA